MDYDWLHWWLRFDHGELLILATGLSTNDFFDTTFVPRFGVDHVRAKLRRDANEIVKSFLASTWGKTFKCILQNLGEEWDGTALFHFPLLDNYNVLAYSDKHSHTAGGEKKKSPLHRVERGQAWREEQGGFSLCLSQTTYLTANTTLHCIADFDLRRIAAGSVTGSDGGKVGFACPLERRHRRRTTESKRRVFRYI